jgi:hypothetical protein
MVLEQAILAFILNHQPEFYLERGDETRRERLEMVASELSRLPFRTAVALAVQGWEESKWARYVAEGCRDVPQKAPDCDHGKARGYWQFWANTCPAAYAYEPGTRESLREEIRCAARVWTNSTRWCSVTRGIPEAQGGFAGFGGGCQTKSSERRAKAYEVALQRVTRLRAQPAKPEEQAGG